MITNTTLEKLRYFGYGFIVDHFVDGTGPRLSDCMRVKLKVVAESGDCLLAKVSMRFSGIWDEGTEELTDNYEETMKILIFSKLGLTCLINRGTG